MNEEDLLVRRLNRFTSRSPSPAKKGSDQVGRSACSDSFGRVSTLENKVQKMEQGQEKLEKGQVKHGVMFDEIIRKIDANQDMLKKMAEVITPSSWPSRALERKVSGRSPGRGCFQCGKVAIFRRSVPTTSDSSPGRSQKKKTTAG